jgi:hypothetical protein
MLLASDFSRITDSAGNPIASATATFYRAATTTLQSIYAEWSRVTPLPNPLTADLFGLLGNVYGDPALAYDIVFKDAAGNELKTVLHWAVEGFGNVINPEAGLNYAVTSADMGTTVKRTHSSAMADTLPAAGTNGRTVTIWNASNFADVVTVTGGGTIDGAASETIQAGQRATFTDDGTEWTSASQPLTDGKRFMTLTAAFIAPTTTNGCSALAQIETATHKVNVLVRDFDDTPADYGFQTISLPPSYDGGNIDWRAVYTVTVGVAGQTLRCSMEGRMYGDDDPLDAAWGTASTVDDTIIATSDVHVTAWATMTPANAGPGKLLAFRFSRAVFGTHADNLRLIEIHMRPSLNKSNDA